MAARIGKAITKYRGGQPGSWLASETKRLGHPISKTTIWRIETGESKNIAVADLLVIAAALNVPVSALLFHPDEERPEVLPGQSLRIEDATRWLVGYPPSSRFPALRQSPELVERTKAQFDLADAHAALDDAHARVAALMATKAPEEEIAVAKSIVHARTVELDDTMRRAQ